MQGKETGAGIAMSDREKLEKYWTEENVVQEKKGYFDYATRRMFDRYLPDLKGKEALDVGCGRGLSMEYFENRGASVRGVDITYDSVAYVNGRNFRALEADARNLPYKDNSFDIVYSIGVIEHFKETRRALEEQVRVCKTGGTVIAVVPNLVTPYCAGTILFEILSGRAKHGIIRTYGKPFTGGYFKSMFEKAGCKDVRVHPYYGSAFLRFLFDNVREGITDKIESSIFSRLCGLVLWGIGKKV
ncbi:MAG: class I SAM-dependent methyltransferase [Candidatus Omnitrophota bacterium]|jgi:ubiquinone/menaquinone biosynthesis C-methylase UbiE